MNLDGFKVFCDLCDTGSFSRAAEASGITQSAVSQQIRAVEKRFGVPSSTGGETDSPSPPRDVSDLEGLARHPGPLGQP